MTIPRWGWIALAAVVAVGLIGGTIWWLRARSSASLPSLQPSAPVAAPTPAGIGQGSTTTSVPRTPLPGNEPIFFLPELPTVPTIDSSVVPPPSQNTVVTPSPADPIPVVPPADTDGDGLTDEQETNALTDPRAADTDADTLSDGDEIKKYRTDPLKKDSDGDGYTDAQEIENGYNPVGTGKCLTTGCIF
ncbi:hypothetical protein KBD61_03530 [Patescibacteria group bacterium]|nr:hypothetical protein [Patescibacteria group bacterium]